MSQYYKSFQALHSVTLLQMLINKIFFPLFLACLLRLKIVRSRKMLLRFIWAKWAAFLMSQVNSVTLFHCSFLVVKVYLVITLPYLFFNVFFYILISLNELFLDFLSAKSYFTAEKSNKYSYIKWNKKRLWDENKGKFHTGHWVLTSSSFQLWMGWSSK